MKKEHQNDILGTLQETMDGLHRIGVVDKITMRQFKEICNMPEVREYPRRSGGIYPGSPD